MNTSNPYAFLSPNSNPYGMVSPYGNPYPYPMNFNPMQSFNPYLGNQMFSATGVNGRIGPISFGNTTLTTSLNTSGSYPFGGCGPLFNAAAPITAPNPDALRDP